LFCNVLRAFVIEARDKPMGRPTLARAAAIAALAWSVAGPALADCYALVGCADHDDFALHYRYLASPGGPTCDQLYQMRNRIYAEHGYCFVTPRGIAEIGNAGCRIHDQAAAPLSDIERRNVAAIHSAEMARRCPA
jgi:hypothetical protein